jgi:hypothetical protein
MLRDDFKLIAENIFCGNGVSETKTAKLLKLFEKNQKEPARG